eukprot:GHVS01077013.1.p1 GENE.GHVS01077013.1~~GHVS01077013.1.p1  ORF type:complete len:211 (+),score=34.66 GHVS01077013.1:97-729(+)
MSVVKKVSAEPTPKPTITITIKKRKGKLLQKPEQKQVRAPRIRKSLIPGRILILLNGPYRGRRVVLLKCLPSGLLLTNGPFELNRIPLRRCSPHCVIATSTAVDVSSIDLSEFDDRYFMRSKKEKYAEKQQRQSRSKIGGGGEQGESIFMAEEQRKFGKDRLSPERIQHQKTVDTALMEAISKHEEPLLVGYLRARFSLSQGDYPHQMTF